MTTPKEFQPGHSIVETDPDKSNPPTTIVMPHSPIPALTLPKPDSIGMNGAEPTTTTQE